MIQDVVSETSAVLSTVCVKFEKRNAVSKLQKSVLAISKFPGSLLFESLKLRPIMNKISKLIFNAVNFITFRINYSVKNFCNFAFILNFAHCYIYRLRFSPASGG